MFSWVSGLSPHLEPVERFLELSQAGVYSTQSMHLVLVRVINHHTNHVLNSDNLTFYLLPEDWQGVVSARGWFILSTIVAAEVVRLAMTFRAPALDHWAHIGGYITGIIWASFKNAKEKKRREEMSWFQRLFSN